MPTASDAVRILRTNSLKRILWEGLFFSYETLLRTHSKLQTNNGTHIYDKEWDVLIVLDACRPDLLQEAVSQTTYDNIPSTTHINTIQSRSSYSKGWMEENFCSDYVQNEHQNKLANTVYVNGNPFSENVLTDDIFQSKIDVWKYGWNSESDFLPARPVTDAAIESHHKKSPEKMIVHYMQPHIPFLNTDGEVLTQGHSLTDWGDVNPDVKTEFERLRDGESTKKEVWNKYLSTLKYVLDDVDLLLSSIDTERAVISADHGNCLGEDFLYGHPRGINHPYLRTVPWLETTGSKTSSYTPTPISDYTTNDFSTDEQLSALGYV